jgi:hypothetical protein
MPGSPRRAASTLLVRAPGQAGSVCSATPARHRWPLIGLGLHLRVAVIHDARAPGGKVMGAADLSDGEQKSYLPDRRWRADLA